MDKKRWRIEKLGNICQFEYGSSLTKNDRSGGEIPVYGSSGILGWHDEALTKSQTLIIGRKGSVGNVFFSKLPCFPIDTTYFIESSKTQEDLLWIYYYLCFYDLRKLNMATAVPGLNRNVAYQVEIPLPPLEEQQFFVRLFQSIDYCVLLVDKQEKFLKKLWLGLINQFVGQNPIFGNLLENKTLKTYKFDNIVYKMSKKVDPISSGIERIVAGENLETEDLKIRSWGVVGQQYLGPAFHMQFDKGDILFGSRRTYLKKVAFAEFSGVCANTTYVIRANENYLLQDLLKHIMLSDQFTKYSIGVSKGSTNPYINWKDLDNYEFNLPDILTQRSIANVLDEVVLIIEMVKDQKIQLQQLKQKLLNDIFA
jgi:type I restriction enzyme S subunit